MGKNYVSWRRVSTFKQNRTGLGLAAQKEIIKYFIKRDGGTWLADYEECYTGKELSGCVELHKAMNYAKEKDAILIIAKSDRFRNTAEALKIYEEMGDGRIMFCDLPATDKFTLTLFFALAEREALLVSIRTKQALAVKKAQGTRLGAANSKYQQTMSLKTEEEKKEISMKRGEMKRKHNLESRDMTAILRILRIVFPDATNGEPTEWKWSKINTANGAKDKIYALMKDYKEMDDTGATFKKWTFTETDERKKQQKLGGYLMSIKRAILKF